MRTKITQLETNEHDPLNEHLLFGIMIILHWHESGFNKKI